MERVTHRFACLYVRACVHAKKRAIVSEQHSSTSTLPRCNKPFAELALNADRKKKKVFSTRTHMYTSKRNNQLERFNIIDRKPYFKSLNHNSIYLNC